MYVTYAFLRIKPFKEVYISAQLSEHTTLTLLTDQITVIENLHSNRKFTQVL